MLPADISERNPELAIFAPSDDGITAHPDVSDSGLVVDDFEPYVHSFGRRGRKGRSVHGL